MKNLLLTTGFLLVSVLFLSASAQNFQPFRKGLTYHFTSQDSVFSMRIDSVKMENGDSVFVFNETIKPAPANTTGNCDQQQVIYQFLVRKNNQFGYKMLAKANREYVFQAETGQEFTLKTKAAVGQSWQFSAAPAVTATLTAKAVEPVATVSDSVLTFTLSNGQIIKLSKTYGFVKAPNFIALTDASFKPKDLEFYALPEKQVGQAISNPLQIFDFQPGDKFGYHSTMFVGFNNSTPCTEDWVIVEVLSRSNVAGGVSYGLKRETLIWNHGFPTAPAPFCQNNPGTTTTSTTGTLVITENSFPEVSRLTAGFYAPQTGGLYGNYSIGILKTSKYNQRPQTASRFMQFCPSLNAFISGVDGGTTKAWYGVGLGEIKRTGWSGFPMSDYTNELVWYVKGNETYGTPFTFAQILATSKELPVQPFSLAPNPFTSGIAIKLNPELQKNNVTVTVLNALGQQVSVKQLNAASRTELKLQLPNLPKGMYMVQLNGNNKTYSSKLVKE